MLLLGPPSAAPATPPGILGTPVGDPFAEDDLAVQDASDWQGAAAGSHWILGLVGASEAAHAIDSPQTLRALLPELLDEIPLCGIASPAWSMSLFASPGEPVNLAALAIEMGQLTSFTMILECLDRSSVIAANDVKDLATRCLLQVGSLENDADLRNARAVLQILGSGFELGDLWATVSQTPVSFLWTDDPRRSVIGGTQNLLNISCYRIHRAPLSIAMLHSQDLAELRLPALRQWLDQDTRSLLAPPASRAITHTIARTALFTTTFDIHIDGGGFLHACAWLDDAEAFGFVLRHCGNDALSVAMAAIDLRGRTPYDVARTYGRVGFLTRAMAWHANQAASVAMAELVAERRGR